MSPATHVFGEFHVGQEIALGSRGPITTEMMAHWAAGSGDFNPIHYDKTEALRQGLPDVIIAGPMKFAMLLDCLTDWAGGQAFVKQARTRYLGMDTPGTVFTFTAKVVAVEPLAGGGRVMLDVTVTNQEGKVNTTGSATLELPA